MLDFASGFQNLYLRSLLYNDAKLEALRKQSKMREVQNGHAAHTVRSHGAAVAKTHMLDWLVLLLLVLIEVILYLTPPFSRYVGKDMMTDLKYPLLDNTVPVWTVPKSLDALCVFAIAGLLFSILVTAVITDAIKNAVGRPRPDFFWLLLMKDVYDQLGNVLCNGEESVIKEGHKSFPSGHTSWSFAGLGFLSLYLSGKLQAFDRSGHVAKLCIVFLPLIAACLVAISRVDDYWHHWQDVFAGGLVVATFCYLQFFPPPYHPEGWGPYAYFRELESSVPYSQAADTVNPLNAELMDSHVESKEDDSDGFLGLHLASDSTMPIEDVESGRRIGPSASFRPDETHPFIKSNINIVYIKCKFVKITTPSGFLQWQQFIPKEKDVKAPNVIERAKEEIEAIIHSGKSPRHHKEMAMFDEDTPIDEVKGPNVFERIKEEIEALVGAIHPKKDKSDGSSS
uniref:Phosphatidic acid phosphatase type 2/haloperoxidase domain-containing protein n=1 Tax=Salix viminalis TaxID=40686 RepID=A0A6N2KV53_SALVM